MLGKLRIKVLLGIILALSASGFVVKLISKLNLFKSIDNLNILKDKNIDLSDEEYNSLINMLKQHNNNDDLKLDDSTDSFKESSSYLMDSKYIDVVDRLIKESESLLKKKKYKEGLKKLRLTKLHIPSPNKAQLKYIDKLIKKFTKEYKKYFKLQLKVLKKQKEKEKLEKEKEIAEKLKALKKQKEKEKLEKEKEIAEKLKALKKQKEKEKLEKEKEIAEKQRLKSNVDESLKIFYKGIDLYKKNNLSSIKKSLSYFKKAIKINPENAEIYFYKARAILKLYSCSSVLLGDNNQESYDNLYTAYKDMNQATNLSYNVNEFNIIMGALNFYIHKCFKKSIKNRHPNHDYDFLTNMYLKKSYNSIKSYNTEDMNFILSKLIALKLDQSDINSSFVYYNNFINYNNINFSNLNINKSTSKYLFNIQDNIIQFLYIKFNEDNSPKTLFKLLKVLYNKIKIYNKIQDNVDFDNIKILNYIYKTLISNMRPSLIKVFNSFSINDIIYGNKNTSISRIYKLLQTLDKKEYSNYLNTLALTSILVNDIHYLNELINFNDNKLYISENTLQSIFIKYNFKINSLYKKNTIGYLYKFYTKYSSAINSLAIKDKNISKMVCYIHYNRSSDSLNKLSKYKDLENEIDALKKYIDLNLDINSSFWNKKCLQDSSILDLLLKMIYKRSYLYNDILVFYKSNNKKINVSEKLQFIDKSKEYYNYLKKIAIKYNFIKDSYMYTDTIGVLLFEDGNYKKSLKYFQKSQENFTDDYTNNSLSKHNLASIYFMLNDYNKSLDLYTKLKNSLISKYPNYNYYNSEYLLKIAESLYQVGNFKESKVVFNELIEKYPLYKKRYIVQRYIQRLAN